MAVSAADREAERHRTLGLNMYEVAERLGRHPMTIARWVSTGTGPPSYKLEGAATGPWTSWKRGFAPSRVRIVTAAERERIRAQVRSSRQRQGLPPHVQDVGLLDRLAAVVLEDKSDPEVGHQVAQPSAAAKQTKGRTHHATVARR